MTYRVLFRPVKRFRTTPIACAVASSWCPLSLPFM